MLLDTRSASASLKYKSFCLSDLCYCETNKVVVLVNTEDRNMFCYGFNLFSWGLGYLHLQRKISVMQCYTRFFSMTEYWFKSIENMVMIFQVYSKGRRQYRCQSSNTYQVSYIFFQFLNVLSCYGFKIKLNF